MSEYTHWLKANAIPGSEWQKVSREDWIKAERRAGFRPKLWSGDPNYMTTYATGGFSDSGGISGKLTTDDDPPLS
jgi:hypothetical protein